jgi:putative ABC transport system ATP-binding protein
MAELSLESHSATLSPRSVLTQVYNILRSEYRDFFVVVIYALAVAILSLAVPIGVQTIVNNVSFGQLNQPMVALVIAVFVFLLVSGTFQVFQIIIVELLKQRLFTRIAVDIALRLPRLSGQVLRQEFTPELMNRFFEVVVVQKSVAKLFLDGIAVVLQVTIGLTILACYHPFLLIVSVMLLIATILLTGVLGKGAVISSIKECSAKHSVLIWLENLAHNKLLFRTSNGLKFGIQQADQFVRTYVIWRKAHFKILLRQNIALYLLQAFAHATLLGLGGYLVINGQLTLGQLVASELIIAAILLNLIKFGRLLEDFYDLTAAVSKLETLVELPVENTTGQDVLSADSPLSIMVKDLSFKKADGEYVFKNLNFSIPAGGVFCILGKNGSGKTLLGEIFLKIENNFDGIIELDGRNLSDIEPVSLRYVVSLVKGIEVFRGTILDNVRLGENAIPMSDIRRILKMLGVDEELQKLPQGLETWIDEDARPLSKGMASRLMLARAFLSKSGLIIVDETFDLIDRDILRQYIVPTLKTLSSASTIIVMTHDEFFAKEFDKVVEL